MTYTTVDFNHTWYLKLNYNINTNGIYNMRIYSFNDNDTERIDSLDFSKYNKLMDKFFNEINRMIWKSKSGWRRVDMDKLPSELHKFIISYKWGKKNPINGKIYTTDGIKYRFYDIKLSPKLKKIMKKIESLDE